MFREWKRGDYENKVMKWNPSGRSKPGSTRATWEEGFRGLLGGKGINSRRLE